MAGPWEQFQSPEQEGPWARFARPDPSSRSADFFGVTGGMARTAPLGEDPPVATSLAEQNRQFKEGTTFRSRLRDNIRRGWLGLQANIAAGPRMEQIERGAEAAETGDVMFGTDPLGMPIYASQAYTRGQLPGVAEAQSALGDAVAGDLAQRVAPLHAEMGTLPQRPATEALLQADTFREGFGALMTDPLGVIGDIGVPSTVQMAPALAASAAVRRPAFTAGAMGATSAANEFGAGVVGYLADQGVDVSSPEALQAALGDPELVRGAANEARVRSGIIGGVDSVSGGLAGRILVPQAVARSAAGREAVNVLAAQPLAQAAMGSGGEAAAQFATRGEIEPGEVLAEALGEFFMAPAEVGPFAVQRGVDATRNRRGALGDTPDAGPTQLPPAAPAPRQAAPAPEPALEPTPQPAGLDDLLLRNVPPAQAQGDDLSEGAGSIQPTLARVPPVLDAERIAAALGDPGPPATAAPAPAPSPPPAQFAPAGTGQLSPADAARQALAEVAKGSRVVPDIARLPDAEAIRLAGMLRRTQSLPDTEWGGTARRWVEGAVRASMQSNELAQRAARMRSELEASQVSSRAQSTMQNRDRSRTASVAQMQDIRRNPDPARLGFSRDANTGAPMVSRGQEVDAQDLGRTDAVVMPDGRRVPVQYAVVEADAVQASHDADGNVNPAYDGAPLQALNNGRTAGLQAAWQSGNANAYRDGLAADADFHGVPAESIANKRHPVLVRLYDPAENLSGADSNQSQQLGLSPVEQAQTDASMLPDLSGIRWAEDGSLNPNGNADFFRAWFRNMGETQAATLQDAQGRPNAAALQRVRAAMVQRAYGDDRLLTALVEDTNPDNRNVMTALVQAAPAFASLDEGNAVGQEIRGALTGGLQMLRDAADRGTSLTDAVAQQDMFGRNLEADAVAGFMAANARSARRMAEAFRAMAEYAGRAEQQAATLDVFGTAPTPTVADARRFAGMEEGSGRVERDEGAPVRDGEGEPGEQAPRRAAAGDAFQLQPEAARAEAPREVAPSQGAGLFGAPTTRDFVGAAQRQRDAERDGRTGTGRTDMAAGDGELFAGPRPEQAQVPDPGEPLESTESITGTPEFRRWSGGVPVVPADRAMRHRFETGQPVVVEGFHGSPDARWAREHGIFQGINERFGMRSDGSDRAFWFASDRGMARSYADDTRAWDYQNAEAGVLHNYVRLKNPLVVDGRGQEWRQAQGRGRTSDVIVQAREAGHDGVVIRNVRDNYQDNSRARPAVTYVAFDPRQIKSATDNSGAFDADNPSSLESVEESRDIGEAEAEMYGLRESVEKAVGPGRVTFLHGIDGLPDRLRRGVQRRLEQRGGRGRTAALYDPVEKKVYLFTDVVTSPDRAVWNALHEIAGHHGLREFLGDRLDRALELALQNTTVRQVAEAISRERNIDIKTQRGRMLAAEEALAELAAAVRTEDFAQIQRRYGVEVGEGIRERVTRAIENFVRRLKALMDDIFGTTFTDEDVRALLENAWQASRNQAAVGDTVAMESIERGEYAGSHQAPMRDSGAPAHDITGDGNVYPDDVYGPNGPSWYGDGSGRDNEAFAIVRGLRGQPTRSVTVYRAVPRSSAGSGQVGINPGDWVAITRSYARDHGESVHGSDGYKVVSKTVKASEIFTNGDSIQEWGYDPLESGAVTPKQALAEGGADSIADQPQSAGTVESMSGLKTLTHPKLGRYAEVHVVADESVSAMRFDVRSDGVSILRAPPALARDKETIRYRGFRAVDEFLWPYGDDVYVRASHRRDDFEHLKAGTHRGSRNHATNEEEGGLSVARDLEYGAGYAYLVRGDTIGQGSDSEPLIELATARPVGRVMTYSKMYDKLKSDRLKHAAKLGFSPDDVRVLKSSLSFVWRDPPRMGSQLAATPDSNSALESVEHTPEQQEFMKKAGIGPDTRGTWQRVRDWMRGNVPQPDKDALIQATLNRYYGLNRAVEAVGGIDLENDPYVAARQINVASTMEAILRFGAPKMKDGALVVDRSVPGLFDALTPVHDNLSGFFGWMVARRAQLLKSQGRENLMSDADIRAGLSLRNGNEAAFDEAAGNYLRLKNSILDFAEQHGGTIDPVARAAWDHAEYIPFYRDAGEGGFAGPGTRRGLSHQSAGIRQLKGGEQALRDPLQNIIQNFTRLIDSALKNRALLLSVDQLGAPYFKKAPHQAAAATIPLDQVKRHLEGQGVPQSTIDAMPESALKGVGRMLAIKPPEGDNIVRVMRDGKAEYYEVLDELVLRSVTALNEKPMPKWFRPAVWSKNLLTAGATSTPDFILRNLFRDSGEAAVTSRERFIPLVDTLKGAYENVRMNEFAQDLMMAGSYFHGGLFHQGDFEATARATKRALRRHGLTDSQAEKVVKTLINPKRWWDVYRAGVEASEMGSRISLARNRMESGGTFLEAAHEAKDFLDFTLRGDSRALQFVLNAVPFMNARLQGNYRLARMGTAKDRKRAVLMRMASLGLATAALYAWNMLAHREEYEKLQDWDKDAYWHIAPGTDRHIRIPKPFELGLIAGTAVERSMAALVYHFTDGDAGDRPERTLDAAWRGIWETLALNPTPQILKPGVEVYFNENTFTGRPIESRSDEFLPPADRRTPHTSDTLAAASRGMQATVGEDLTLSPKQLQHLWRGYFGGFGMYFVDVADVATRALEGAPPKPATRARDLPGIGAIYRGASPDSSTRWVDEMYDLRDQATTRSMQIKRAVENGETERALRLQREHDWLLGPAQSSKAARGGFMHGGVRQLNQATNALAKLRKADNRIYEDRSMTRAEKREALDKNARERDRIARELVRKIRARQRTARD